MVTAEVSRLEHKTLHERVYEELVRLIADRVLPPGTQLDEQTLAARLGVSRTPLRAAIARLVQEGLVVAVPYRGAFVRRFTADEIDGLYEVRSALEQLAARRAAERMDAARLAAVAAAVAACEAARERGDVATMAARDAEFHRLLVEAAGNATLIEVLNGLDLRIQGLRDIAMAEFGKGAQDRSPRRRPPIRPRIVDALRRRNGEEAARLMGEHIDSVRRNVVAHLAREGQRGSRLVAAD